MIQFSNGVNVELSGDALLEYAREQANKGFAPPAEIYQIQYRKRVDWNQFPGWARPVNPELFDGCCHEG